jgi:hypothetical protein
MLTMNPTLLVGPSDWDGARLPQEEFAARTAALWRDNPSAAGAIVYGDRVNHAELAYLTHFTPKLEAALALIPRTGAATLLVGGGANMLLAAKPLTFIADLRPLRNVGKTVAQWAREQGGAPVLIGGGAMSYALRQEIADARGGELADGTGALRALMRRKSARELALLREACATLAAAVTAMRAAQRTNAGATDVILAGERAANRRGAQDVRTLFSLDGGRTLRPFETAPEHMLDPLQVYVAVRLRLLGGGFRHARRIAASVRAARRRCAALRHRAPASRRALRRDRPRHCAGRPSPDAAPGHGTRCRKRDGFGARGASADHRRQRREFRGRRRLQPEGRSGGRA